MARESRAFFAWARTAETRARRKPKGVPPDRLPPNGHNVEVNKAPRGAALLEIDRRAFELPRIGGRGEKKMILRPRGFNARRHMDKSDPPAEQDTRKIAPDSGVKRQPPGQYFIRPRKVERQREQNASPRKSQPPPPTLFPRVKQGPQR
jgi:hypothetical protein